MPDKRETAGKQCRRRSDRGNWRNGSMMRDFNVPGRSAAMAANGMAATSHPMATLAALDVLRSGGNAADAAIAAVAMQCVVEPESTGSAAIALSSIRAKGALPVALNGSGRAPAKAKVEWYVEHGDRRNRRADTACGDGARRDRRLVHLQPRIRHAPARRIARAGSACRRGRLRGDAARRCRLAPSAGEIARSGDRRACFCRAAGRRPPGDKMRNPPLAATLRRIGREGPRGILRRRGHARDRRPAQIAGRAARRRGFRRPALELGRADPRLLSRLRGL